MLERGIRFGRLARRHTVLAAIMGMAALSEGCAAPSPGSGPGPELEGAVQRGPGGTAPRLQLAEFVASIDPVAGSMTLEWSGPDRGVQPHVEVPVAQDQVPGSGPPDTVELVTEGPVGTPPDGCGAGLRSFEATVTLRSFYVSRLLANAYVEITEVPTGNAACNSDPAVPGVTAGNGGLWSYGTLGIGADRASSKRWKFHYPSNVAFTVKGKVVADLIPAEFRFVSWADTKSGTATLRGLAHQLNSLGPAPALTIYEGDLEDYGFTTAGAETWRGALNEGTATGLYDVTFPIRGNHDAYWNTTGWSNYFDNAATVSRIGGSNYQERDSALTLNPDPDLTYSFDYGYSHFVGLDIPGDIDALDLDRAAKLAWLDADLAAAEGRGLTHAFVFWHGPLYTMTNDHHVPVNSPAANAIAGAFGNHAIVSATFHGHEHLFGYVHMDVSRNAALSHDFEEFITGAAGAPDVMTCNPDPIEPPVPGTYTCVTRQGFATVDVSGRSFTVDWYAEGEPAPTHTWTFVKP